MKSVAEGEGTETLGENAGSSFAGSSLSPAPLCETRLCVPGCAAGEDSRTVPRVLVWGREGAELPVTLEAPWVSNTGTVLLSSLVAALTTLGMLVRGRLPPVAEVLSGEVLSGADGEPVSNGFTDDRVAPLPPPPWVPKEDWEWPGELMFSVPVVETSVVWARVVLAGRDLNVLPPPLVPVV